MKELVKMWTNTRMVVLTAVSAALYVALLIPFKFIQIIPGLIDFRPGAAIPPLCSLAFGPAGAFGAAFGNLIGDFFGTLTAGSPFGFLGNFLYGYIPYRMFRHLGGREFFWKMPLKNWLALEFTIALSAVVCAVTIGFGLELLGIAPFVAIANLITLNNLIFGLTLGPALLIATFGYIKQANLHHEQLMPPAPARKTGLPGIVLVAAGAAAAMLLGNFPGLTQTLFGVGAQNATVAGAGAGMALIIAGTLLL